MGPNFSFVAQGFQRVLYSEHSIEFFPVHAGVISLGLSVVNKSSISADVLLLDYSIFLLLFLRSDVAAIVMHREFLKH